MSRTYCALQATPLLRAQGSLPASELRRWVAAVLCGLGLDGPDTAGVSALLEALALLKDEPLINRCLASEELGSCCEPDHAPAVAALCALCGWRQGCLRGLEALLRTLVTPIALATCVTLLREVRAAAARSADPAAAAGVAALVARVVAVVVEAAERQPPTLHLGEQGAGCMHMIVWEDEVARDSEGLLAVLGLLEEAGDEAQLQRFLITGFARNFHASPSMLARLRALAAAQGWAGAATVVRAIAAGCVVAPCRCAALLALLAEVRRAAGSGEAAASSGSGAAVAGEAAAAAALLAELPAAFVGALPAAAGDAGEDLLWQHPEAGPLAADVRAVLDWLQQSGSPQQAAAFYCAVAARALDAEGTIRLGLQLVQLWGWGPLAVGLRVACIRCSREDRLPRLLTLLEEWKKAAGQGAHTAEPFLMLASVVAGAVCEEGDRNMRASPWEVENYDPARRRHNNAVRLVPGKGPVSYHVAPTTPPRTAAFVRHLLLALHLPGCSGGLARACPCRVCTF